jgi:hypothetical protein
MKKRLLMLLVLVAIVATAPMAMADHCVTCKFGTCRFATLPAYRFCEVTPTGCSLSFSCGGPHPLIEEEYFTTEFVVASVERLDEPQQPTASETRVASLEKAPQQHLDR